MNDAMRNDSLASLQASAFGQRMGPRICEEIIDMAEHIEAPADATLFSEAEEPSGLFLVLEGQVKLIRSGPGYREHIVNLVEDRAIIGEASLFLETHPVTAVTLKPTRLLRFPREPFLEVMGRHPVLMRYLLDIMAHWLRQLIEKIDELTLCDGAQRLARYLMGLHAKSQYSDYVTSAQVELPTRKRDLATMLNMNQPSLSRILRQFQDEGLVEVSGRRLVLKDLDALRVMARLPKLRQRREIS